MAVGRISDVCFVAYACNLPGDTYACTNFCIYNVSICTTCELGS